MNQSLLLKYNTIWLIAQLICTDNFKALLGIKTNFFVIDESNSIVNWKLTPYCMINMTVSTITVFIHSEIIREIPIKVISSRRSMGYTYVQYTLLGSFKIPSRYSTLEKLLKNDDDISDVGCNFLYVGVAFIGSLEEIDN